jgi:hypothetical protein
MCAHACSANALHSQKLADRLCCNMCNHLSGVLDHKHLHTVAAPSIIPIKTFDPELNNHPLPLPSPTQSDNNRLPGLFCINVPRINHTPLNYPACLHKPRDNLSLKLRPAEHCKCSRSSAPRSPTLCLCIFIDAVPACAAASCTVAHSALEVGPAALSASASAGDR